MQNLHFLEKCQVQPAFMPVNMATGANNGDWVKLTDYRRCAIIFVGSIGTAGDDPTITVLQATDTAGSNPKALTFTRVDKKQATALTSVGQFTTITQAAADTYTNDTLAELQKVVVIDIKAEDLDIANGFEAIQASVADVGTNAQLATMIYVLHEPRFASGTTEVTLPSAI